MWTVLVGDMIVVLAVADVDAKELLLCVPISAALFFACANANR